MEKLKKYLKTGAEAIITVLKSDLFKIALTFASLIVAIIAISWGYLMTVFTKDITNVAMTQEEQIKQLEDKVTYFSSEAARQRMIAEEYYELFINCVECESWYENFYYDNVDPYTGEIEGEYYE